MLEDAQAIFAYSGAILLAVIVTVIVLAVVGSVLFMVILFAHYTRDNWRRRRYQKQIQKNLERAFRERVRTGRFIFPNPDTEFFKKVEEFQRDFDPVR